LGEEFESCKIEFLFTRSDTFPLGCRPIIQPDWRLFDVRCRLCCSLTKWYILKENCLSEWIGSAIP